VPANPHETKRKSHNYSWTTTFDLTPGTTKLFDVPDKTAIYFLGTQTGSYPSLTAESKYDKDSLLMGLFGYAGLAGVGMVATNTDYSTIDSRWSQGTEASTGCRPLRQASSRPPRARPAGRSPR